MWKYVAVWLCLAFALVGVTWTGDVTVSSAVSGQSSQCPGDFNGDGKVNLADFLVFAGGFGARSGDANFNAHMDLDGSGAIDLSDFLAFAGVFGTTCEDRPDGSVTEDRAALVALYNATDGPNWVNSENWLTDAPLGEWYGVGTDASGRVTSLELDSNALSGVIPAELRELRTLQRLHLTENGLYGHIPPELGMLGDLQSLRLRLNLLTRTIPPTLGNLAQLQYLSLEHNRLEGTIPPELGDLSKLRWMRLDSNELSGSIPSQLGSLTNLSHLNLGWNNLVGPIPPELGNLAILWSLALNVNELTGPIPPELGNLTKLGHLSLGNNGLTGRIPPWLADLTQLRDIGLHGNALTGPIPPELGNLAELTGLTLSGNQLTGPIPPELGNLAVLEKLSLGSNQLSGPVPPELGNLRSLVELTLSDNQLSGSLPHTISGLDRLVTLGCRQTRGVCMPATEAFRTWARQVEARGGIQRAVNIPLCNEIDLLALERLYEATKGDGWTRSDGWLDDESLARWHGVTTDSNGRVNRLDLSGNGLSGHLPDAMGLLASLKELRIGGNALSGRMPMSLVGLTLAQFDYAETALCVVDDAGFRQWLNGIPRHKGTGAQCPPLTDREALEWVYRRTDGPRWKESTRWLTDAPLAEWHGVETDADGRVVGLNLTNNGMSGEIPSEIGELSALTHLDLSSNRLEGAIPAEIGRLSELRELKMNSNVLTGPIPPEIGGLSKLTKLNLGGNRLSDAIPAEIARLSELRRLELGSNNLSGPIPPEVGDLSRLEWFRLAWNQLSDVIPVELGQLSSLRQIDLGNNVLSGSIPPGLGALDRLQQLHLEQNRLSGGIPEEIGRLANLARLNLGENQLSGSIPPELGNLNRLDRLSLESNQLSGEIPKEIGRLANLARLNLAENQLAGPIPAQLGNLSNLAELNLGDNRLTGRLPAELAGAGTLETLDLRSNALSGPVPPEFGNLTLLTSLILADNPALAGTLPTGITALGRLERFMAGSTGLCRPADAAFDTWFAAIPDRRLVRCEGGTPVYLTQAVQSWDDPVPLLAGMPALLRVFVTAPDGGTATMPDVRATFYVDGAERHSVHIARGTRSIPMEVTESDLALSANAEIPSSVISPGLEMVIEVDPERVLDPSLGVTKRIPEEGRMSVDVRAMPPLHLTLVPLLHETEADLSIVESVQAMAGDPNGHELLADVRTLFPITDLAVAAHEPVTTSFHDPYRLLRQTEAMRTMEGGSGYWMGLIQEPPRTGGTSFYYLLPSGVAYTGGVASVSVRIASTIAHELGHNLALEHAPCGNPSQTDPWFPYLAGNMGAWGYDVVDKALVAPATPDLMSYCTSRGYWISDYHFNKALNHRLATAPPSAAKPAVQTDPVPSLLLWGGQDKDGVPYLDPAFVVDATPSLPAAGGDYSIEGVTADGVTIFTYAFDMPVIGDAEGEASSFVFALPLQSEWADNLASITLSGPGGIATLDEGTDRPMAILRDLQTGQVRGFLADLSAREAAQAAEGVFAAKPGVEVLFSRGIPELR
ncbi:MAG: M66 family metalloprotease [Gemmatimonadetes bacterium]|nr:M66 family metalloprotease [Gemmatimonadota bacterium]